jgi:predicted MarR family transcription regulator
MTKSRIVSSSHLVSEKAAELSEYEYGLMVSWHAFQRWVSRCMAAAGYGDLASLDILVLHSVNHRNRAKRLADICFTLNVEDTHTVTYALKKLLKADLVTAEKRGKEVFYTTSDQGRDACQKYREVREACLVDAFQGLGGVDSQEITDAARTLRALSGLYDQAARSATSL